MRYVISLTCVSILGACATDDSVSGTTQAATVKNKLAANKLAANKLAANKLAANKLAANKLAANKLAANQLSSGQILSSPDGRTVYSYIVSCALPADQTIVAIIPGATSTATDPFTCTNGVGEFPGNLGLTPQWVGKKLSEQGKGWISACMFARINAFDTSESISVHGENASLTVAVDEAALYTVEEGAFYGNMFTPEDEPIAWYACRGEAQAEGATPFGGLVKRACARPDPANPRLTECGFNYAGDCADFTPLFSSPYACEERESGDPQQCANDDHGEGEDHGDEHHQCSPPVAADHGFYYEGCHTSSGIGKWQHAREFDQVITTFVTP